MAAPSHNDRFEKFPSLPTEIRLLIWRMARRPRLVEIVPGVARLPLPQAANPPVVGEDTRRSAEFLKLTVVPAARAPAVLHANQEARYETLPGYYLVRFPTLCPDYMVRTPRFLFHPEIDTLRLATWCLCHDGRPPAPSHWVSDIHPPACGSLDGLVRALGMSSEGQFRLVNSILSPYDEGVTAAAETAQAQLALQPSLSSTGKWESWAQNLVHLAFDASLFLKLADYNDPRSIWAFFNTRTACDEITALLETSESLRTCTITMASAPLSPAAPRFPLPGDAEVTQTYNVRAVRIAKKHRSASREPRLVQDGAVMIYHDARPPAPGSKDLAIFELVDEDQQRLFTRRVGGATALARRISWLIRTAPGPRAWLRILAPVDANTAFRDSFSGDMKMLLTEWLLLEQHTSKRRLAAVCHGICMPDYGF
ncbi:hypothetical protein GQ53DRAFT_760908 [Thozetella sp. PMI_491]|nr:hypothetical protein GQ53DRAFT_760908 [Thozetella sp. PMI_491]